MDQKKIDAYIKSLDIRLVELQSQHQLLVSHEKKFSKRYGFRLVFFNNLRLILEHKKLILDFKDFIKNYYK